MRVRTYHLRTKQQADMTIPGMTHDRTWQVGQTGPSMLAIWRETASGGVEERHTFDLTNVFTYMFTTEQ